MKWSSIFLLNLAFICKAARVGYYNLTDSRGYDLYDFSNSGHSAELSSINSPLFISTDRGYFIYGSTYIHFPSNKYNPYPSSSELILGFWHKVISQGCLFTLNLKEGDLFSLVELKYSFHSTWFSIQLYKDSVLMTSANIFESTSSNKYIANWKFGVIYVTEVAEGIQILYYTRNRHFPEIDYTLGLSLSNQANSFMIGSGTSGITGYIYEIYWFDALDGTIYDMFSSYIAVDVAGHSCHQYPIRHGGCLSEISDPFASSNNVTCSNTCMQAYQSCIGTSINCITFPCSSDCITGCYNMHTPTCICQGNCKACYLDSLDNKICSECGSGYYILPVEPEYSCVLDCPLEYYADASSPMTCQHCGNNCLRCMSQTICTECMTDFYLKESECVSDCGIGYISNDYSKECEECASNCEECIYLNGNIVCKVCIDGTYNKNGVCLNECGLGFYQDENIKTCVECEDNCDGCDSDMNCIVCNSSTYLKEGICEIDCGVGYYTNSEARSCIVCTANCDECGSDMNCIICNSNSYFKEGLCEVDCGVGYYTNNEARSCEVCIANCDECNTSSVCTICNVSTYLKQGSCVESCGIGYYMNDSTRICEACPTACDVCNIDPTLTCIECSSGYYLENDECTKCSIFKCLSCESEGMCSMCEYGNVLVDVGNTRVCEECADGMYESEGVCKKCPTLCDKCENLSRCTECIGDVMLDQGSCLCNGEEVCTITPSLSMISYLRIYIKFNIPLPLSLDYNHISLTLNNEVLAESSYSILETIQYTDYIVTLLGTQEAEFNLSFKFTSSFKELVSDYTLGSDSFTLYISPDSLDSDSDSDSDNTDTYTSQAEYISRDSIAVDIHSKTQTTAKVSTSCSLTLGFFSPSALWSYLNTIQMLSYLAMLNIELPLPLFALLTGSLDFNPLPNILRYLMPIEGPLPIYRAILIGYDTSQFIYNIGTILFTLFLFLLAYPLLLLIQILVDSKTKVYKLVSKGISNYRWNVFSRLIIQHYIELELAAVFQIQSLKDFSYDWSGIFNLILGSIFLV